MTSRCQVIVLVALLLPPTVLLQDRQEDARAWIEGILKDSAIEGKKKEGVIERYGNNRAGTPSSETLNWLNKVLQDDSTTTTTTTPDTSYRFDLDFSPDMDDSEFKPCVTKAGFRGFCVPSPRCANHEAKDQGTLLIDRDDTCPFYLYQCCVPSDVIRTKIEPQLNIKCGSINSGTSIFRVIDQNNTIGTTSAEYGEYPWMIALIMKSVRKMEWSQKQYLGGGTLIHPSVVITAAHKVNRYTASQIKCRAGEWDTQSAAEMYPHQDRDVKKIITHEEFHSRTLHNDISMLVMNNPFELQDAPHIGIACLGGQLPPVGTKCYSMGWGKNIGQDKHPVVMKKVELPYVASNTCQRQLRRTRLLKRFSLHSSLICAGGIAGADTCEGDGGSPLACPITEAPETLRLAVYGMVAFGVGCGKPIPAVYVNVPQMHSWVDSMMTKEGFNISTYKP